MSRKTTYPCILKAGIAAAMLTLCLCALQDDEMTRSNPYDPGGDNWTRNGSPELLIVELDSTPLWSDFDFDSSTGSIDVVVHAFDPNQRYDVV